MKKMVTFLVGLNVLTACTGGDAFEPFGDQVYAPSVSGASDLDGLLVGHRLMAAGEYELALRAYTPVSYTHLTLPTILLV